MKNGRDPIAGVPCLGAYVHAGEEAHVGRADPHPDIPSLGNMADHDATTGYLAHCTEDDPAARSEPVGEYLLMFLANRLKVLAHRR